MSRTFGLVGTGTGAPFGGGSPAPAAPSLTQPTAASGLSVDLGLDEGVGTVRVYANDFVFSPGSFSNFEIALAAEGPWGTSILLTCAEFYSSPLAIFLRGTTPSTSTTAEGSVIISDNTGWCGGG